jgi:hypothetical protein
MHDFFCGWRRKLGCVTLVMALAFVGGWVRSGMRHDFVTSDTSRSRYGFTSFQGRLQLGRWTPHGNGPLLTWGSINAAESQENPVDENGAQKPFDPFEFLDVEWRWDWGGFHFGASMNRAKTRKKRVELWVVPYWSITVPLTLLSAFLLLTKPSPAFGKKVCEPIPAQGT